MAVMATPIDSKLRLVLNLGEDPDGKIILSTRNYNKIKPDAEDQQVFEIAQILEELHQYPVQSITRLEESKLEDEM